MTDPRHGVAPTDRANPALELAGVTVEQAGRHVLDNVSFSVERETTVAVAGASDIDSATLARTVAGGVLPDEGAVLLDGEDVTALPPHQRQVGHIPAGGGLLPHLTAEENIRYGARLRHEPRYLTDEHVEDAVDALELRPALDLRPHEMSATQRLRTAIARVATRRPQPPMWVVDATADGPAQGIVKGIHRAFSDGVPTILICATSRHDGAELGDADRLLVLQHGRVTADGPLEKLRAHPGDLITARLALPAPLPTHTGEVTAHGIECDRLTLPKPAWIPSGERVCVALPSEALSFSDNADEDVKATVVDMKLEGARTRIIVEPLPAAGERWAVRCDSGMRGELRQSVWVRVDPDRMLVFRADSGHRWERAARA